MMQVTARPIDGDKRLAPPGAKLDVLQCICNVTSVNLLAIKIFLSGDRKRVPNGRIFRFGLEIAAPAGV
jgi:hypothetical protein